MDNKFVILLISFFIGLNFDKAYSSPRLPPIIIKDSSECDDGWYWLATKKSCIKIQENTLSWDASEADCTSDGTHLVSIDSAFEEDEIKTLMQKMGKCSNYWIGARRGMDGNFAWSDGSQFYYSNFAPGNGIDKNCTNFNEQSTYWQTTECAENNCYICEKPSATILPNDPKYSDCLEIKAAGQTKSGVYGITVNDKFFEVYCDMETEGGGWTVIQQRVDGTLEFWNQKWNDYKQGFGDYGEISNFWAGNDVIHEISSKDEKVALRIDLWGDQNPLSPYQSDYWWSEFEFRLDNESTDYTLHASILKQAPNDWVGTGNASTNWYDVTCEEGVKFSTVDKINDPMPKCVTDYHLGGWWLHYCSTVSLNGEYKPAKYADGYGFIWLVDGEYMINPVKSRMSLRKIQT